MDTKTVLFGVAVVVASAGGSKLLSGSTTKAVPASISTVDATAATVANLGGDIASKKRCILARVGTDKGIELQWECNGAVLGQANQAELWKLGGADATDILFDAPAGDGKMAVHITTGGAKPNLDPIPEAAEAKPVEAEKMPAQSIPVDEKP
jgi:hypothetical protein